MHVFAFESYGVKIRFQSMRKDVLERARRVAESSLLGNIIPIPPSDAEHIFTFGRSKTGLFFDVNGENGSETPHAKAFYNYYESILRVHVAEYAKDLIFLHAGAIAWKGKGILFPADSYQGKTTLVAELVKRGAVYYSDDFAILDKEGLLHPFPRKLSIRDPKGSGRRSNVSALRLGGSIATGPIPVTAVILSRFKKDAIWRPRKLSPGKGIMQILPEAIPLRANTKQTLKVLQTVAYRAIIAKSFRGDTKLCLDEIISYIEKLELRD